TLTLPRGAVRFLVVHDDVPRDGGRLITMMPREDVDEDGGGKRGHDLWKLVGLVFVSCETGTDGWDAPRIGGGGQTGAAEATMFHVQQKLPALSGGGRGGSNIFLLGVFRAKCFGKRFGVWESRRARPHVRQSDAAERQRGKRKQQARRLRSRAVAVFETHRTDRGGLEVQESYCYCFSWCPLATNDFKRLETWTGLDCQSLSPKVVALGFATESRVDFHVSCPSC
ncbi:hypothetical protein ACHAWF_007468, partial [Thalassiosira exigua]